MVAGPDHAQLVPGVQKPPKVPGLGFSRTIAWGTLGQKDHVGQAVGQQRD